MKNKILFLILLICLSTVAFSAGLEGDGSRDNPYIIGNAAQLNEFARLVNLSQEGEGLCAKMVGDIDFTDLEYTVIGSAESPYSGEFDGNGYSVKNVYIDEIPSYLVSDSAAAIGLFGFVDSAVIKGLHCENIVIDITDSSLSVPVYAGITAGVIDSTASSTNACVLRCFASGYINLDIVGAKLYAAGLAGYIHTETKSCGITVSDCNASVDICVATPRFSFVGGLAGCVECIGEDVLFTLENSYACGNVSTKGKSSFTALGGIVGYCTVESDWGEFSGALAEDSANVKNCFSLCSLSTDSSYYYTGSVCGYSMTAAFSGNRCGSAVSYCSSTRYSHSGESTDKEFFETEALIKDTLQWDTENTWCLTDGLPMLVTDKPRIYTSDGKALLYGKLPESGFALMTAFLGTRQVAVKIYDLSNEDVPTETAFDRDFDSVSLFIFKDLSTISPYTQKINSQRS